MRYVVDLRHPLRAPCGGDGSNRGGTRRHIPSRRGRENVAIPKGFPKSVGRVEAGFMAFHALSFPWPSFRAANAGSTDMPPLNEMCCTRHEMLLGTHRMSMRPLPILSQSRRYWTASASPTTPHNSRQSFPLEISARACPRHKVAPTERRSYPLRRQAAYLTDR
jgi:hypothetical protein